LAARGFDVTIGTLTQNAGYFTAAAPAARPRARLDGVPKSNARVIGALFPLGFLSYGIGFALVSSATNAPDFLATLPEHQTTLVLGAFLMLLNTAVDIAKGVLLFPVLEAHDRRTALAYLAAMTLEVALLAMGIVSLLMLAPLGQHAGEANASWVSGMAAMLIHSNATAYGIAMMTLAVANVFVWSLTFRVRLIPRWLSFWGIVGYVILTSGSVAEMFGIPISLMASIPGGLFELALGCWLIARGFAPASLQ
jgi:Domain of unknown function (DUF4386)